MDALQQTRPHTQTVYQMPVTIEEGEGNSWSEVGCSLGGVGQDEYSKAARSFLSMLFGGDLKLARWSQLQKRSGCDTINVFVSWLMDLADTALLTNREATKPALGGSDSCNSVVIASGDVDLASNIGAAANLATTIGIVRPPDGSHTPTTGAEYGIGIVASGPPSQHLASSSSVNKRKREHPTRLVVSKSESSSTTLPSSAALLDSAISTVALHGDLSSTVCTNTRSPLPNDFTSEYILTNSVFSPLPTVGGVVGMSQPMADTDELMAGLSGFTANMFGELITAVSNPNPHRVGECSGVDDGEGEEDGGTLLNLTVMSASAPVMESPDDETTRSYQEDAGSSEEEDGEDGEDLGEHLRSLGYDLRDDTGECGSPRASSRGTGTGTPPVYESILSPCCTLAELTPAVITLCANVPPTAGLPPVQNGLTSPPASTLPYTAAAADIQDVGNYEVVQNNEEAATTAECAAPPQQQQHEKQEELKSTTPPRRKKQRRKCSKTSAVDQNGADVVGAVGGEVVGAASTCEGESQAGEGCEGAEVQCEQMVVASTDSFIERDLQYHCGICRTKFRSKASVKRHLGVEHSVGPPSTSCQVCGKTFKRKDYLRDHMVRHTGATPFMCPVCGEKFSYRAILSYHMRSKHKDTSSTAGPAGHESELGGSSSPPSVAANEVATAEANAEDKVVELDGVSGAAILNGMLLNSSTGTERVNGVVDMHNLHALKDEDEEQQQQQLLHAS